jgi:nucleoside-diphosphate-sugar epimerase
VLLTGANGFTGVYMREELERHGYEVVGAVVGLPAGPHQVALDITSPEDCRAAMESVRPDYLVHLAAISFVQHADAEAFYRVNVLGTLNLLQAVADAGLSLKKALIASSANIYGNSQAGVITEAEPPAPVNHYACSKLAMEYMVRTWFDRIPIVITRPFNYTGAGQEPHFLVPKIVSHFKRQAAVIELGNLDIERDFSDVRTVVGIYRRLLETDAAQCIVNVCSGRPYALRSIVEMMNEICRYEIEIAINPAFVRSSDVKTLVGSADYMHRLAGEIESIPLEQTLRWMMEP